MIDYDKFKYRIGDKIKRISHEAEYQIIGIQESLRSRTDTIVSHYRIKNLSPGCIDHPTWYPANVILGQFEPCNPAIKLLYQKKEKPRVLTFAMFEEAYKKAILQSKSLLISSGYRSGKSSLIKELEASSLHRAKERSDLDSLDAFRYTVHGQTPKKVSR
jgi:hypothetical protein